MWHDLVVIQVPVAEKVIRTVAVYATIIVLFRLTGKRGLAALNTFDVVVVFLLSNVVQNAVIGNDDSLLGGLVGAATLVAVNAAVNRLSADHAWVARLLEGTPTTVIEHGRLDERAVRRLALRSAEIDHAVRMQDADDVSQVESGRLEPGGQLVLTLKDSEQNATKGDVAALVERIAALERLLQARTAAPGDT